MEIEYTVVGRTDAWVARSPHCVCDLSVVVAQRSRTIAAGPDLLTAAFGVFIGCQHYRPADGTPNGPDSHTSDLL